MRLLGWTLILVLGGAWAVLAIGWLVGFVSGGFDSGEGWVSLAVVGVGGAIAALAVGVGALLIYRAKREEFPKIGERPE